MDRYEIVATECKVMGRVSSCLDDGCVTSTSGTQAAAAEKKFLNLLNGGASISWLGQPVSGALWSAGCIFMGDRGHRTIWQHVATTRQDKTRRVMDTQHGHCKVQSSTRGVPSKWALSLGTVSGYFPVHINYYVQKRQKNYVHRTNWTRTSNTSACWLSSCLDILQPCPGPITACWAAK